MISIILSACAFAISLVALVVALVHARNNKRAHKSLVEYCDRKAIETEGNIFAAVNEINERGLKQLKEIAGKLERLEQGVVPDYNEALAAANAVNDFNKGISAILGYDPGEAMRASRKEGGEVAK